MIFVYMMPFIRGTQKYDKMNYGFQSGELENA